MLLGVNYSTGAVVNATPAIAKTNMGRCVAYANATMLDDTNSIVRRVPKMRGA